MNGSGQAGGGILSTRAIRITVWISMLSAFAYLAISLWSGWSDVLSAIRKTSVQGMLLLLCLSLLNYGLRYIRWRYYLDRLGHHLPDAENLRIYIAGFGLTIVPGKVGEAVRSVFLKQYGVGYRPSLAVFFTERLSDLISMLCLAAVGVWSYRAAQPALLILSICIAVIFIALHRDGMLDTLQRLVQRWFSDRFAKLAESIAAIVRHSRICLLPTAMAVGLSLGVVAWTAEGVAFHLLLGWMGVDLHWQVSVFIYAFAMLAGAASFLPGGLGGADAAMIALLLLFDIPMPVAVAATIVIRIATLWFAVVLGMLALGLQLRATVPSAVVGGPR